MLQTEDKHKFTVLSSEPDLRASPALQQLIDKHEHMKGHKLDIWTSCAYIALPLVGLNAVFLALIHRNRVSHHDPPFPQLPVDGLNDDSDAYFVDLSSTLLIFISSWMSSLTPLTIGFMVSLAAYQVSQRLLQDTNDGRSNAVFTPYQLSLALRATNGATFSALWLWVLYLFGWSRSQITQARALTAIMTVTAGATLLSTLVLAADTWLHISTTTVNFLNVSAVDPGTAPYNLELLSPNCTSSNNSVFALAAANTTCGFDLGTGLLIDSKPATRTLNNMSNELTVLSNGPDSTLAFLGISDSARALKDDFSATTLGMKTTCKPVSRDCNMQTTGNMTFDCNNGSFTGDVAGPKLGTSFTSTFYADATMSERVGSAGVQNPYYFGFPAALNPPNSALVDDPDIITGEGGGIIGFVLFCTVTTYDVEYDFVQGKPIQTVATPSNASVANIFEIPMDQTGFGQPNIQAAVTTQAQFALTAQELADALAMSFSRAALSAGVQTVVRAPAVAVQQRDNILVAKVPKAPLFALVAASLAFVSLGLILTIMALGTSQEAREVQVRLGIAGLIADRYEAGSRQPIPMLESAFAEHSGQDTTRVGIFRSEEGGYAYKVVGANGEKAMVTERSGWI